MTIDLELTTLDQATYHYYIGLDLGNNTCKIKFTYTIYSGYGATPFGFPKMDRDDHPFLD